MSSCTFVRAMVPSKSHWRHFRRTDACALNYLLQVSQSECQQRGVLSNDDADDEDGDGDGE